MSLRLTDQQSENMDENVVEALHRAFDLVGFKPDPTSMFRTRAQGEAIGSLPTSAHERGLAADLARPKGIDEAIMLAFALGWAGFPRFEVCSKHFHVDMDTTKRTPLIWKGESK